ncbi:hypothetical protein XENTR_v10015030 [Xenopus tropicalis]|nr:hypothetical protein XENTR_v10015030 [Xenopus tropicalis]
MLLIRLEDRNKISLVFFSKKCGNPTCQGEGCVTHSSTSAQGSFITSLITRACYLVVLGHVITIPNFARNLYDFITVKQGRN